MLDASNPDANSLRAKKQKSQSSRTPERYWPHTNNGTQNEQSINANSLDDLAHDWEQ